MDKVRLGDVCTVVSGSTPKTGVPEFWDGDIDWITPAELTDETYIITESARKITEEAVKKTGLKSFPAGTVILSSRAPIGKVAIAGKEMYCNQGFKNLICSDRINAYFLFWFLRGNTEYLNSLGRGATFKEISKSIVENIKIQLPSMPEQIRCAETLKQVWDVVALRRQQLTALDTLIKARFVEMFGGKKLPEVELISLISEGAGLSYGIVQPGDDGTGDMGVLRPVDFVDGQISTASIKYIDRSIGDGFRKTELSGNELLITVRGTTGITALTDERFIGMNVTRGIAVIRYDDNRVNPLYLNAYLNTEESQRYIQEHTRGATLQQINLSDLRVQKVKLPSRNEQDVFAAFIAQVNKSKAVVQKALDEAQTLFDSLMQQYFG